MAISFDTISNFFQGSSLGKLSNNFVKTAQEFAKVLYTDGSAVMKGNLDLNSNRIINAGAAKDDTDIVSLGQAKALAASIPQGPPGPPGPPVNLVDTLGSNAATAISQRAASAGLTYQYDQSGTPRAASSKLKDVSITPEDFGATANQDDDQTAALNLWLSKMGPGVVGRLNARVYKFSNTLVFPAGVNHGSIVGDNSYSSRLVYTGTNPSIDLMQIGSLTTETRGWKLKGFMLDSVTQMTGGYAFHAMNIINSEFDIVMTGFYGPGGDGLRGYDGVPLWNGWYFNGYLYCKVTNSDIKVRNDAISVRGNPTGGYNAELIICGGQKIAAGRTGLHLGGACGGIIVDDVDIIGCGQDGILIDTSLVSIGNNQIFLKSGLSIDQCGRDGIRIDDSLGGYQHLQVDGTWSSSNLQDGIHILNFGNASSVGTIHLRPGKIQNNQRDGVRVETNLAYMNFAGGIVQGNGVGGIGGYGINNVTPTVTQPYVNLRVSGVVSINNGLSGSANYKGVINGFPLNTYRTSLAIGSSTTSSPTTQFTVPHGLDGYAGFRLSLCLASATASYLASSGQRVVLQIVAVTDSAFVLQGAQETGKNVYVSYTYTPDTLYT